jgi:hypothetical protein
MGTPRRTKKNPFGLTYKQDLVLKDVVNKVERGKKMDVLGSVEKFYEAKNRNTAKTIVKANMMNTNFREALVSSLVEKRVLGADSITEGKLIEGLDATEKDGSINYDTRLKYIQEVNKIGGVYAPEKRQSLNLNMDMTEEELDKHIKELKEQLE